MRKFALPIVLLLVLASLQAAKYGLPLAGILPDKVTAAVIIEETAMRPKLDRELLGVLNGSDKLGVKVLDQHQKDKAGNCPPKGLEGFWKAADMKNLPQLVVERNKSKYKAQPCPSSIPAVEEALR